MTGKDETREEQVVRRFLTVLRQEPTDATCQRCLSQLDAYVSAQLSGAAYRILFAETADHLDSCQECTQAYALLYETQWAEKHGRLPSPAQIPEPNLEFLKQPAGLNQLREALRLTRDRLQLQLNAGLTAFLQPPPAIAFTRSGDEEGRYGRLLLQLTPNRFPDLSLPISMSAYQDKQDQAICLLEVTVEPPGQSWPDLGGREVTISVGEERLTAVTDDWGTAVFPDISITNLDSLRLDVALN